MFAKHCRHCNAKVPQGRGWLENYCCEDHRVAFQDRQHRETVERLRREEPDEQLESEFALHTFEPRRVRVTMLGGATLGPAIDFETTPARPTTNYISRPMPPAVNVQPLVAPALHAKAPVEQSLAALSFVAEPVSAPLQMPTWEETGAPESLGASVRRASNPAAPAARRNDAIVNLIRGAQERMVVDTPETTTTTTPSALGTPSPTPAPKPNPQQPSPGKAPGNGARARSIAITVPPARMAEYAGAAAPSRVAPPLVANARVAARRVQPDAPCSAPSFSSVAGSSPSGEGGQRASIVAAGLSIAAAIGFSYFLFR
jgi:hypothetical protein